MVNRSKRGTALLLAVLVALLSSGCGGGGTAGGGKGGGGTPPSGSGVTLSLSASADTLETRGATVLTATVTGSSNTGVTWSVQESNGGTVVSGGLNATYFAPTQIGQYHVVATSQADPTKHDSVAISVWQPITVTVNAPTHEAATGGTIQFSATVNGSTDQVVTWSVQEGGIGGTIDGAGLYVAPSSLNSATETFQVVAVSHADPARSGRANVTVTGGSIGSVYAIPAARRTTWQPGVTYTLAGGIPHRTAIHATLTPRGGGLDDTGQINNALAGCPKDGVVQLAAGTFNITGNGIDFHTSDCTLRGAGTGAPGSGAGGTRLIKADRDTNPNYGVLYVGNNPTQFSSSTNLADSVKGDYFVNVASAPGLSVGEIVLIDEDTWNPADPIGGFDGAWWGPNHYTEVDGASRRWFCRQNRSLSQVMEVAKIEGTKVTFTTPLHWAFKEARSAQLTRFKSPAVYRAGIEDLYLYGGRGGDWHGNLSMSLCAYCWVKNIESHFSGGTSVGLYATFRSELRDSYIHESSNPTPGGDGYLTGLNYGASDNLVENNIMWYGNKVVVMRATGGGNVFAYNYTDDALGANFPMSVEAGINAGHYTTPHMELLEGNYSQNFKGDSFWGNSIYITVFRNHLTALRRAVPPLNTYVYVDAGGMRQPYRDLYSRAAVDIQDHSLAHNVIGNVLGLRNQELLSTTFPWNYAQSGWRYEAISGGNSGTVVPMWMAGENQTDHAGHTLPWNTAFDTEFALLRDGNWDWYTKSIQWHGVGGAAGAGTAATLPDSLYLPAKPAFFGANPWPWVDPNTGTTFTLPAKARFDSMPGHNI